MYCCRYVHFTNRVYLQSARSRATSPSRLSLFSTTPDWIHHLQQARETAASMLRGVQRSSALLRSGAVAGSRARCPRAVLPAAADASAGVGARAQPTSRGAAFDSSAAGRARWMSAATPGSTEDKKDEPEAQGFLSKLMSKESCVVSFCALPRPFLLLPSLSYCVQRKCISLALDGEKV